ncbi:MAG: DMT family transporter [Bacteroidota bacterium]
MKDKKLPIIYFFAVACMLIWGLSFVFSRIVLDVYTPVTIIFIRMLISSAILIPLIFIHRRHEHIELKDFLWLMLSALFEPFCYFIGENYGILETSSTISAVIIATIPLLTPIAAFYMLKEKLSWLNITGIFISFSGIIIMLMGKDFTLAASPKGIAFLFFAVFAAIISTIIMKKLSNKFSSLTIIGFQNLLGGLYFLPLFFIFDAKHFLDIPFDVKVWGIIVFLAIFASSLAFIMYVSVVRHLGASRSNIFTNIIPVATAFFSFLILHEQFTFIKVMGIAIVIVGVMLSQFNRIMLHIKNRR